jgi:hypothetical protein
MPYLNLDLDYFDHRKTKRLVGLLGRGAEVIPIKLWSYCGKFHADTGRLAGYSEQEIESLAGWWGKSGAMLQVEFMGRDEQGWFMVEFADHQGHIAAFKAKGRAMAKARWAKADACSNAASMLQAMPYPTDPTDPIKRKKDSAPEQAVEFPPGFPKTEADALTCLQGIPEEFAKMVWNECASRFGRDCFGNPVGHWPHYVKGRLIREQSRQAEKKHYQRNGHQRPQAPSTPILDVPEVQIT